jgi:LacI family transcriptional regulator
MIPGKRRKRSPRFVEIAAAAGVSASTVDRVLNERGSVSQRAREAVLAAAHRLGAPRILPNAAHALMHLDALLPDSRTPFFLRLRYALAGAGAWLDKRVVVHRRIYREGDEKELVKAILEPEYRRRGLIVAAPDAPKVRDALRAVVARGEGAAAVVSRVGDVAGVAYCGIDNYRAGRTAGLLLGRFARQPGRVMFLIGSNAWEAHQERTRGAGDALRRAEPGLVCDVKPFETLDDADRCYLAVAEALRAGPLAGLYNSGAGSAGIMRALETFDPQRRVTWITHELSDDHRIYLRSGAMAMAIDQDPDMQIFSALRWLVERSEPGGANKTAPSGCEFRLYFAENLREGPYLPQS